jgi:hypothetical protein
MTVTGTMIIPLDQRRRDALMNYAVQAADGAGVPRQSWCRKVWKLKDYEAKDLLKGNASETVWERIMKMRGPHCGWAVALPVTAAVVGQDLHEFFREQMRLAAKDAEHAKEHERIAEAAYRRLADDIAGPGEDRRTWSRTGEVGARPTRRVGGGQ